MSKPEWGLKRLCQSCGAKFYDMLRSPITCPSCGTGFDPEGVLKSRRRAAPKAEAEKPKVKPAPVAAVKKVDEDEDEIDELKDIEDIEDLDDDEDDALLPDDDEDEDDDEPVVAKADDDEDEEGEFEAEPDFLDGDALAEVEENDDDDDDAGVEEDPEEDEDDDKK